jgi:UDP-N-acetylglucosamine--N-acetylmuramyl-(pentapeptide) pyrophosphoryl-undecaprenol N-acetylglucosamine transferase
LVGKPVILVPSPNVAEDHQTKNAMALVAQGAALMVSDDECHAKGLPMALELLRNPQQCEAMGRAIKALAVPHATEKIVDEIDKLVHSNIDTLTH